VIDLVFAKVAKILAEIIGIDYEDITPQTELTREYGIKAVDVAKLVIECEKRFGIIIHDEDVHTLNCVNDMTEYIRRIRSDR
jgi:acyl carrier protein